MKKQLVAIAVAAAVAAPAMAQNVTISGRIGAGMVMTENSTSANTSVQDQGYQYATNVIQIAGSEDLGGGLKASFVMQGTLDGTKGQLGNAANTASDGALFDRASYIELSGAFGSVKMGRVSDMLDTTEGYANHVNLFDTELANNQGLGNKTENSIRWDSPKFLGGVTVGLHYTQDARTISSNATTAATENSKNISGAVQYASGPLTVGAAYGEAGAPSTGIGGAKLETYYAGYVLPMGLDLRAQLTQSTAAGTTVAKSKTTELSAKYGLGAGVNIIAHIENFNVSNANDTDYAQRGVMITKDLSKRTTVFAGYKNTDLDASTSNDATVTTFGVSHAF